MKITFENGLSKLVFNERELEEALTTLKTPNNTFFILEQANDAYLQARLVEGEWWVEKREANTDFQLRAFGAEPSGLFSVSELNAIASCYLHGKDCQSVVEWREMESFAQVSDTWFARPPVAFCKQATVLDKLRWLEAWKDYLITRLFFIGLVAVGVGFVVALLLLIWRDLFE